MANILYARLFAKHRESAAAFLRLSSGQAWSYAEYMALSHRYARVLVQAGVVPGDRIVVQVEKSPQALALYAAAVQIGAIYLPLNTAYTLDELSFFLTDCQACLFIGNPEKSQRNAACAQKSGADYLSLGADGTGSLAQRAAQSQPLLQTVPQKLTDVAALLYTSGTTGRPKGAKLTQGNLLSNAEALVDAWKFSSDDTLLHALPLFHAHGLFVGVNVTLLAGGAMWFLSKFEIDPVFEGLAHSTTMMGVPTFYTRLLADSRLSPNACAHMRLFISGSAPLLENTHIKFKRRTGHHILERYGMTETTMIASNPYEGERRAGTVGFPLPGVDVRITDPDTGEALSNGQVGHIEVRGPNVFAGYWNLPERTAEEFRTDGFFVTGDLGKFDAEDYLHIVGREKDLIISGGYNIYPKEIERVLDAQPGVLESAVIGVPHADFGETPVAILVPDPSAALDLDAVRLALQSELAGFKQPRELIVRGQLPRNTMGKVQKNILRDNFMQQNMPAS